MGLALRLGEALCKSKNKVSGDATDNYLRSVAMSGVQVPNCADCSKRYSETLGLTNISALKSSGKGAF